MSAQSELVFGEANKTVIAYSTHIEVFSISFFACFTKVWRFLAYIYIGLKCIHIIYAASIYPFGAGASPSWLAKGMYTLCRLPINHRANIEWQKAFHTYHSLL